MEHGQMSTNFPFTKVLVTGGAGFIGSRVVPRLEQLGVQQVVVDNLYVGIPLPDGRDGVVPVEADIRDRDAMRAIFAEHRPEAILHLAAVHHIPTCEREPHLAFDVNVMGTQTLLDVATEAGVRDIVFTSSGAVYQWKDGPLQEASTPTGANDVYSITKLSGEYQVAGWAGRTGGRAHVGRLFNTIGTGDPNGHLIPDLLSQLTAGEGESVTVKLGNTKPKRDYIHVDDVADAFVALLAGLPKGEPVEYFNICTGNELSVAELVEQMGELLGLAVTIESDPTRFRKIDRLQQLGAPGRIAAERGWQAEIPAREALARIMADLGHDVRRDARGTVPA
jgi:UDP-glucose 4-epimerase